MKYNRYYSYCAILEPYKDSFAVYFPDLPGAYSCGDDVADAVGNAKECLAVHIRRLLDDPAPLPTPSKQEEITVPEGCQIALISIDLKGYFPEDFKEKRGGARTGAGRPKNSGRQASKLLVVRMTEKEDETLTRLASDAKKTKSEYIRELIAEKANR